eukprot:COSAG01_NODE_395_length_17610_cov_20.238764_18_plen_97_part_00
MLASPPSSCGKMTCLLSAPHILHSPAQLDDDDDDDDDDCFFFSLAAWRAVSSLNISSQEQTLHRRISVKAPHTQDGSRCAHLHDRPELPLLSECLE